MSFRHYFPIEELDLISTLSRTYSCWPPSPPPPSSPSRSSESVMRYGHYSPIQELDLLSYLSQPYCPSSAPPPAKRWKPLTEEEEIDMLTLSLCLPGTKRIRPTTSSSSPSPPSPSPTLYPCLTLNIMPSSIVTSPLSKANKTTPLTSSFSQPGPTNCRVALITTAEDIPRAPYPWAVSSKTEAKAITKSLKELQKLNITKVRGVMKCKICEHSEVQEYDIEQGFAKITSIISEIRTDDRAPEDWVVESRYLKPCSKCGKLTGGGLLSPEIPENLEDINWLFMLLSKTLGTCNLTQLRYFSKRTKGFCTSAKNRLILLAYTTLCKQLDPTFLPNKPNPKP